MTDLFLEHIFSHRIHGTSIFIYIGVGVLFNVNVGKYTFIPSIPKKIRLRQRAKTAEQELGSSELWCFFWGLEKRGSYTYQVGPNQS